MQNLLLEKVEYKTEETTHGTWRRFVYPDGHSFAEFRSHVQVFGMPFLHYTRGRCPETGKRLVAKGFIAVGRFAAGVIAVGQASAGIVAVGQASAGILLSLAQIGTAVYAAGQIAVGILFGVGQLATGLSAIGQLAMGNYVLAQVGFGEHLWTPDRADPEAIRHFQDLWNRISSFFAEPD